MTDRIAERYVRLAHAIDAHSDGFIDGYGGPREWAVREKRDPAALQQDAQALLADVAGVAEPERRAWLEVQVRAMHTMARLLAGEALPYEAEVRGLYDIEPRRADLAQLDGALAELERVLPGSGTLAEREEALRGRLAVPRGDILRVAQPILTELRARVAGVFGLPDGEDFRIGLVNDKPWSGYNWPLGNLKSRIDINTDLPVVLPALPDLMAHEGYPGHHTEHATKEARLVRERGWAEHSVQLINAPECVVSEGIAVNALRAVMPRGEVEAWLTGELSAVAGVNPEDVQVFLAAGEAKKALTSVSGEAAMRLHADGAPESEVLEFLRTYALASEARAAQSLRFLQNPNFRAYIFTYAVGGDLVRAALERGGTAAYARLLREPVTPGQLRA
ncbi:DUF885 domain-containing protein [Deinococcus taeanensis]|uniref:DUF885 domain-containing protein n=1 Tax=Deinococcus taeanensis TaxID=2737050 RepID=UPI001CDD6E95|nr:DUF885 domain-containing protein [Deinococcus taeanensis]UBV42196.1 DUF885 domain-containing protein [Deinococcus taeanensis]